MENGTCCMCDQEAPSVFRTPGLPGAVGIPGTAITPPPSSQGEPASLDTLRRLIQEELGKQLEGEWLAWVTAIHDPLSQPFRTPCPAQPS